MLNEQEQEQEQEQEHEQEHEQEQEEEQEQEHEYQKSPELMAAEELIKELKNQIEARNKDIESLKKENYKLLLRQDQSSGEQMSGEAALAAIWEGK